MNTNSTKIILLVEDEALVAEVETRVLESYGYQVIPVRSGEEAIEAVDSNPDISLVLMDTDLGNGIDGVEAAERILTTHDLPIVFLSSHTKPEVMERTEAVTSYGYVVKNGGETALLNAVRMAYRLFQTKKDCVEGEKKFHQLFEHSTSAVALHEMIYDDNDDPIDYRFIAVNPAFEKIMGLQATDVLNKRVLEILPETEQHWIDTLGKVARTGVPIHVENYARALDKYVEVTAFQPEENHFATIVVDITERKRVEELLLQKEQHYQSVYNGLRDALIVVNGRKN